MRRHFYTSSLTLVLTIFVFSCGQKDSEDKMRKHEFGNIPAALADSLKKIGTPIQTIEIDPNTDNTIVGYQGTIVLIPGGSLVDEDGKTITTKTTIQLKECYSFADIISSNLQTVHNG